MTAIPTVVKASNLRAEFYRNDDDPQVWVKITNLSSKDWVPLKATPELVKQYAADYEAFEKGAGNVDVGGTSLMEVPGITKEIARQYRMRNIRNAEELAAISDAACTQIGLGALSARKAAQNLLRANQADALQAQLDKRGPGRPPKEVAA